MPLLSRTLAVCLSLPFAMTSTPCAGVYEDRAAGQTAAVRSAPRGNGSFSRLEARFELPGLTGNPFDFTENDVRVTLAGPGGASVEVPAFFDGGATWRVRYTPSKPGAYRVGAVTRNGNKVDAKGVSPETLTASGPARPGFVRRGPGAGLLFAFDDGNSYYPVGFNIGWTRDTPKEFDAYFTRMGASRLNWSRVWMCHWDGKNLDWVQDGKVEPGHLSLDVARRWDALMESAEKNGVRVQVVLQHHGQYSSTVNPNWPDNPWNAKNPGGFLATPEEFFTSEKARALTRAKYRYVLARYGAYDSVLAWELFNEVEWVDAIKNGKPETVVAWHREMADFLKKNDAHGHLVTTSSKPEIEGLYDAVDYVQPHHYPSDAVGAVMAHDSAAWKKPVFVGEIGPQGDLKGDDGRFLRRALWASMMTGASGAAQYWDWENVDARGLYSAFRSAADFAKLADLGGWSGTSAYLPVATATPGSVSAGPGRGWEAAKRTEYAVLPSGRIEGIDEMPSYLQGTAHREMFPKATFRVRLEKPGQVRVRFRQ
ncbi:MAG TPA: DUF5060 domain-containing protein, partial [Armatimonadaceae bacterium]|nr:DUF5060 domain-containing protein [Armatimonadaceae bacterium]